MRSVAETTIILNYIPVQTTTINSWFQANYMIVCCSMMDSKSVNFVSVFMTIANSNKFTSVIYVIILFHNKCILCRSNVLPLFLCVWLFVCLTKQDYSVYKIMYSFIKWVYLILFAVSKHFTWWLFRRQLTNDVIWEIWSKDQIICLLRNI